MKVKFSEPINCFLTKEVIPGLSITGEDDTVFLPVSLPAMDGNEEHFGVISGFCVISKFVNKHNGKPVVSPNELVVRRTDVVDFLVRALYSEIKRAKEDNEQLDEIFKRYGIKRVRNLKGEKQ